MIAALLANGAPVKVFSCVIGLATVVYLGRNRVETISRNEVVAVAQIDEPDECDELQNYLAAVNDSDELADERAPFTAAALEIEEIAKDQLVKFIHTHSIPRGTHAHEFTPEKLPIPASLTWEGLYAEGLCAPRMAIQSAGS